NSLLAGLIFTPTKYFNGNFSISTSISDGIAAAITSSKAMTGTAVNNAPGFENLGNQIAEDEHFNIVDGNRIYTGGPPDEKKVLNWASHFVFGPTDESNQQVKGFNVSTPDSALFAVGGLPKIDNDGNLTFTPAPNSHGTATVTVDLQDDGGIE